MKKIIILAAIAFGIWACGGEANSSTKEVDGKLVYQRNCLSCHGANGNQGYNGAKALGESALTMPQRVNIITNGSENNATMVAFKGRLSDEEIKAVAQYTMSFKK